MPIAARALFERVLAMAAAAAAAAANIKPVQETKGCV